MAMSVQLQLQSIQSSTISTSTSTQQLSIQTHHKTNINTDIHDNYATSPQQQQSSIQFQSSNSPKPTANTNDNRKRHEPSSDTHTLNMTHISTTLTIPPNTASYSSNHRPSRQLPSLTSFQSSLPLPIFRHQVAGHKSMLWHRGAVYKPLIQQEYEFYVQLPIDLSRLLPHVPKFYGVADLRTLNEEIANSAQRQENTEVQTDEQKIKRSRTTDDCRVETTPSVNMNMNESVQCQAPVKTNIENLCRTSKLYNQWALQCELRKKSINSHSPHNQQQIQQFTYSSLPLSPSPQPPPKRREIYYLVLEDLTFPFIKPSVMDLKIGTRQHSDNEPPSKIASKTARCLSTTSHSLALRLCGLQVYKESSHSNIYWDKYRGRQLSVQGFIEAVRFFFHDGQHMLIDIMMHFVERLNKLADSIAHDHRYRFYSSSILLVYEGDRSVREAANATTTNNKTANPLSDSKDNSHFPSRTSSHVDLMKRQASTESLTEFTQQLRSPQPPSSGQSNDSSIAQQQSASLTPSQSSPSLALTASQSRQQQPSLDSSSLPVPAPTHTSLCGSTAVVPPRVAPQKSLTALFNGTDNTANTEPPSAPPVSNTNPANATATRTPLSTTNNALPINFYYRKRSTTLAQARERARALRHIDVRLIDFAHTAKVTTEHEHDNQDNGLSRGLHTLINIIETLAQQEQQNTAQQSVQELVAAQQYSTSTSSEATSSYQSQVNTPISQRHSSCLATVSAAAFTSQSTELLSTQTQSQHSHSPLTTSSNSPLAQHLNAEQQATSQDDNVKA